MIFNTASTRPLSLDAVHRDDLRLAAPNMLGAKRRAFQAAMALKYCAGSPRQAEAVFGWSRQAVELGLHEQRTGIVCLSAQSTFVGDKLHGTGSWDGVKSRVVALRRMQE